MENIIKATNFLRGWFAGYNRSHTVVPAPADVGDDGVKDGHAECGGTASCTRTLLGGRCKGH